MASTLPRRVFGVAASAGGVEALRTLVSALPADFDSALCVVLHIPPTGHSLLAPILDRETVLEAVLAEDGMELRPGMIYVAPADHHLLVREDRVELSRGPKENGTRPAADPLLRSIARAWGPRGAGVILSGALDDGAAGVAAIAQAGGVVLVQDPDDALVPGMPAAAIAAIKPDVVLPVAALGAQLAAISSPEQTKEAPLLTEPDPEEVLQGPIRPDGPATGYTCPECSGALWQLREGNVTRYRCRVGHAYSEETMVEAQGSAVEAALWAALEVLEERCELLQRIADRNSTHARTRRRFETGAREAAERAAIIRDVLAVKPEAAA